MKTNKYDELVQSLYHSLEHTHKHVSGDYGEGMIAGLEIAITTVQRVYGKEQNG